MNVATGKEGLIALLEPSVSALGYELVDLDVPCGGQRVLRIFIDQGDGIDLIACLRAPSFRGVRYPLVY